MKQAIVDGEGEKENLWLGINCERVWRFRPAELEIASLGSNKLFRQRCVSLEEFAYGNRKQFFIKKRLGTRKKWQT